VIFEIYRDSSQLFHWRLYLAKTGVTVAQSPEGVSQFVVCEAAIQLVKSVAPAAEVVVRSGAERPESESPGVPPPAR
jgi:uncharacterized protein YegP (UPF0339 family)